MDKEKKCNHENCNCEKEELATIVTFTDDDGKEIDFQYIHSIEKDGKKYGAFEPLEELPEEEAGIVILEITKEDEESFEYAAVEDEALLDELFEQLCADFDAMEECDCDHEDCHCGDGDCHCHDNK